MKNWRIIGNTSSTTEIGQTSFLLKPRSAKKGDFVCIKSDRPSSEENKTMLVWGVITNIFRKNDLFHDELLQKCASSGINMDNLPLRTLPETIKAELKILGTSDTKLEKKIKLSPLSYSVKPGSEVLLPDVESVKKILFEPENPDCSFPIGTLLARSDIPIFIDGNKLFSHTFITGQTGKGKSATTRTIIDQLIRSGIPTLLFDQSGRDYLGFYERSKQLYPDKKIKLFSPRFVISNPDEIFSYIERMSTINEVQSDALSRIIEESHFKEGQTFRKTLEDLIDVINSRIAQRNNATLRCVNRCLRKVLRELMEMENENEKKRKNFPTTKYCELPDVGRNPEELIMKDTVSIINLESYRDLTRSTLVAMVLDNLFNHRLNGTNNILPFIVVLEEGHNYAPSSAINSKRGENSPSLPIIRKIAMEGRKLGCGMIIITQSPSQLDDYVLAQCSTNIIGKITKENDLRWIGKIIENCNDSSIRDVPSLGIGQAIIAGTGVNEPVAISVNYKPELESSRAQTLPYDEVKEFSKKNLEEKNKNDKDIEKIINLDQRGSN